MASHLYSLSLLRRHLSRVRPAFKQGNEFSLDPMREQDEDDLESGEGGATTATTEPLRGGVEGGATAYGSPGAAGSSGLTNGFHHDRSPKSYRAQDMPTTSSPK